MADASLNHCSPTLNVSLKTYDLLYELINKSKALTQTALNGSFSANTDETIFHYLCVLDDVLESLREAFNGIHR